MKNYTYTLTLSLLALSYSLESSEDRLSKIEECRKALNQTQQRNSFILNEKDTDALTAQFLHKRFTCIYENTQLPSALVYMVLHYSRQPFLKAKDISMTSHIDDGSNSETTISFYTEDTRDYTRNIEILVYKPFLPQNTNRPIMVTANYIMDLCNKSAQRYTQTANLEAIEFISKQYYCCYKGPLTASYSPTYSIQDAQDNDGDNLLHLDSTPEYTSPVKLTLVPTSHVAPGYAAAVVYRRHKEYMPNTIVEIYGQTSRKAFEKIINGLTPDTLTP